MGTRHLISLDVGCKDVMIFLLQQFCSKDEMPHRSAGLVEHHTLHKYVVFVHHTEPFALTNLNACDEAWHGCG